jgi:hypothetical protein
VSASPFGRYAPDGDQAPLHQVRLLNLPVRVLVDERERHDSMLREFALLALDAQARPLRPGLAELAQAFGVRYAAARSRPDGPVDEAVEQGLPAIDVTYEVPAGVLETVDRLEDLMAEADDFCRSEQLLTLPRNALQLRFDTWYFAQFRRQLAGEPPQPWDGPLDP